MERFKLALGDPVKEVDEEIFELFCQMPSLPDLGMLDAKAPSVEVSIAGQDFEILQSPGLLLSNRSGGTTGAALWRTSIQFAEWFAMPTNPLFAHGMLNSKSTILELGTGISGLVPCILSQRVGEVLATDQAYILQTLRQNVASHQSNQKSKLVRPSKGKSSIEVLQGQIRVLELDWESDEIPSWMTAHGHAGGVDAIIACDCIYNYALIDPFVQTCAEICAVRKSSTVDPTSHRFRETLCIVVQQLRQAEVFEQWLHTFRKKFQVWRLPNELLGPGVDNNSGIAIHVGLLSCISEG